jgi:chromosome segregation ATPase
LDSDDEDEDFQPANSNSANPDSRRETIRKQRIESEQRRRDELREGYARLRETLPTSNQKASKVSLLDRATTHIRYLDTVRDQLEARLKAAESEVHRLRSVNEALMLGTAEQRHAAAAAAVAAVQSSY